MNTENQNIEFKESWGCGIEKICTLCKNYGIPEPEYTVHPGDIMLKFRAVARIENHTENHTENHRRLSRLQREILVKVQEDPSYTRSQLASMIDNASLGGVISALSRLQELGIIRRVGPDKGGHWELLQQS
ncbi:MAG: hypothetical protein IJP44_06940 [Bacteroidales bacterium]|nr:hypothetical protein [Bacteroidales bacterium]